MNIPIPSSLGDFFAFTNSIIKLTRELKSPALASSANAALITELECLCSALVSAERCISSHNLAPELRNGIKDQVELCSQTLSEFGSALKKYHQIKAHGGLKNWMRRLWMKVMVGICGEKEKERLIEGIRTYVHVVNCYLAMDQVNSSRRIVSGVADITGKFGSMQSLIFSRGLRIPRGNGDPELGNSGIGSPDLPVNITLEFRQPFVCRRRSLKMPHRYESFKYTVQVPRGTLLSYGELNRALRKVASQMEVQPRPNDEYINSLWWDFDSSSTQYRGIPTIKSKLTLDSISLDYFSTDVIFSVQSQERCCWTAGNWNSTSAEFLKWACQPIVFQENSQLSLEYVFNLEPEIGAREIMESDPYFCTGNAETQDSLELASCHTIQEKPWGQFTGQFTYEIEELG